MPFDPDGLDAPFFRIQAHGDPADDLLDPERPDGWVADDESYEEQPLGVSACDSLEELAVYAMTYNMSIRPGDRVLGLYGRLSGERDRDPGVRRVVVEDYVDIGDAVTWLTVYQEDDEDALEDLAEEAGEVGAWARHRLGDL